MLGSGYVVSPRLRLFPGSFGIVGNDRVPLELTDQPTSRVQPVNESIILDADSFINSARLVGGFTQSPIFISVEANSSGEKIESVSLVIDGVTDAALTKTESSYDNVYNFAWVPDEVKDYTVTAIVRDVAGNVVSTEESMFSIQNYEGAGVNLSLQGENNFTIEANGQLLLIADATSQYGIAEVEFYIDDQSVGIAYDTGGTSFQTIVDLSDGNLSLKQGDHEITIVARDKMGNWAGTFSRNLTNLAGRMNRTLTLLPPLLKDPPSISLKSPSSATTITVGSSIRLHADANDSNGDLYGVQFYSNQELLEAWSGSFDFNNTLPQDGETITLYDGTTNSALTFEFDDNQSVFGGGVPSAYASQANVLDDLTIEGNLTYFSAVQFLVEIDRLGDTDAGTADTFRWSLDGGLSFVQEYVPITAGTSQSLIYGLDANFTNANGHGLGDRWTFTGRPLNQIVSIASGGSNSINVSRTRDDLQRAIEYSRSQGLLGVRTYLDTNDSWLYLAHTFSQATIQDVAISGTALSSNGGSIILLDNDANGDGEDDNYVLSQAKDGKLNQPFGLTWEANETGEFIIFAIAEDS